MMVLVYNEKQLLAKLFFVERSVYRPSDDVPSAPLLSIDQSS